MAFDPKAFLAEPSGFDPQAFLGVPDFLRERGQKQPDGTYLVDTPQGPVRFDAQGNEIQSPEEAAARKSIGEESTKEAALTRVLATAQGGAQGFIPQVAGLAAAQGSSVDEAADSYRREREKAAKTVKAATEDAGLGYQVAGAVLSSGPAAPESIGGRAALSAALGGANALAESQADLTKGEVAPALRDAAAGAGVGLLAAGAGELLGAGVRKALGATEGKIEKIVSSRAGKDLRAAEARAAEEALSDPLREGLDATAREVAGLPGVSGFETSEASRFAGEIAKDAEQSGMRMGNTARRHSALGGKSIAARAEELGLPGSSGFEIIEGSRFDLPAAEAVMSRAEALSASRGAEVLANAARATDDYFAEGMWRGDVVPMLRKMAPRTGMAALAMVGGEGIESITGGSGIGRMLAGTFAGTQLGAPGLRSIIQNIAKSPRVQLALTQRLAPVLQGVASLVARGLAPTAATLGGLVVDESVLGPPDLAAEQLIAAGGIKSVLGVNKPIPAPELDAAQGPADLPIKQTMGVMLLGGALEDHSNSTAKAVKRAIDGGGKPPKYEPRQLPKDFDSLLTPEALLERVTANTGSLHEVAPGVAAQMMATAQRAVSYLTKVAATPAPQGPLAAPWERSAAERRALSLAVETVESPLSVLEYAAAGMLAPEQVAALNAVYPAMGRELSDKALTEIKPGMPYASRLMVAFLAGVDPDGSIGQTASNQAAMAQQPLKPSMQMPGPKVLSVAERTRET